jgi:hypothetical protein
MEPQYRDIVPGLPVITEFRPINTNILFKSEEIYGNSSFPELVPHGFDTTFNLLPHRLGLFFHRYRK